MGATTVGTGGDWSTPAFRLGANNVLVPQLLGRSFQKASNFTASVTRMQDLASEFSKISRGDNPGPSQREGATPSRTKHPARPLTGRGALGPKPWPTQLFSGGCIPAQTRLFCSCDLDKLIGRQFEDVRA